MAINDTYINGSKVVFGLYDNPLIFHRVSTGQKILEKSGNLFYPEKVGEMPRTILYQKKHRDLRHFVTLLLFFCKIILKKNAKPLFSRDSIWYRDRDAPKFKTFVRTLKLLRNTHCYLRCWCKEFTSPFLVYIVVHSLPNNTFYNHFLYTW